MSTCLLGIPTYNGGVAGVTLNSVMNAFSACGHKVQFQVRGISLLARNFNTLWCDAWNKGFDFFVLLHADLGVETDPNSLLGIGPWLDTLINMTVKLKADVTAAVVAIKSQHGHTTLGLDFEPDKPYTFRRVTIRELNRLPNDFIARQDVCKIFGQDPATAGAMLINTGCLCMRLRGPGAKDWTQWPGFAIEDKIVFNRAGKAKAFTLPEDWRLSRWLYANNYRYYALPQLITEHSGAASYVNRGLWGMAEDGGPFQMDPSDWKETGNGQA